MAAAIEIAGIDTFEKRLREFLRAIERPGDELWNEVGAYIQRGVAARFATDGWGQWPDISASWRNWKADHDFLTDILRKTDALRNSLTERTRDTVWRTGPSWFEFGTKVTDPETDYPYPGLHQNGWPGAIPARPFLVRGDWMGDVTLAFERFVDRRRQEAFA